MLVAHNSRAPRELKQAIAQAAEAGMGVVAMKTQAAVTKPRPWGEQPPPGRPEVSPSGHERDGGDPGHEGPGRPQRGHRRHGPGPNPTG